LNRFLVDSKAGLLNWLKMTFYEFSDRSFGQSCGTVKGCLQDQTLAKDPIVMAMANADPEIIPEEGN
jgi:hypothetical protein